MKRFCLFVCGLLLKIVMLSFLSCDDSVKQNELKIASWNVQTFFDANLDNIEYSEFIKSKTWNVESYKERLVKLCQVIKTLDADVFIMQEIENENVLYDIKNFLAGEWNQKKVYKYSCFAKKSSAAIGCAVLSRVPLKSLKCHSIDVRLFQGDWSRSRPIMEVEVDQNGKPLTIFVNHWKSKSGGQAKTEKFRNCEEGVLAFFVSLALKANPVFIAGDFNKDIREFAFQDKDILLRFWNRGKLCNEGICVKSLWFDSEGELIEPGSYYFREEWSYIDNFFCAGQIEVLDFYVATQGEWCHEETKIPKKYSLWNKSGYSDHLPIVCKIKYK